MVNNKTRKVQKYRGHTTHGGGHRKKRRGAGSRGGVGNAGSGKRAGHKRKGVILGSSGFRPRRTKLDIKIVNLGYFTSDRLNKLIEAGKIKKEGDVYNIDLKVLGYNKLLSTGKLNHKITFNVDTCSAKVEEKVKLAGGNINLKKVEEVNQKSVEIENKEEVAKVEELAE